MAGAGVQPRALFVNSALGPLLGFCPSRGLSSQQIMGVTPCGPGWLAGKESRGCLDP